MAAPIVAKFRRGSTFKVEFPTVPSLITQPRSMELRQVQGEHEQVILKFLASSHLWFDSLLTGTPIRIVWGTEDNHRTWYGYVSFVNRTTSPSPENEMEIHCIGATFPLKERTTKVIVNTTIPDAVKGIVEKFGFKYIGEQDDRVFDQITIAGHSYWEWIQEQAKRIGYGVIIDGMDFVFKPIDKLIDQGVTAVPIFSFGGSQVPAGSQLYDRTLDVFKVSNGEYVENQSSLRSNKLVGGVNPENNSVISSSYSPKNVGTSLRQNVNDVLFSEVRSEQVVHNVSSANSAAKGAASLSRMATPAKAIGQGDARVRPYYPVYVNGTGTATDGFWIVKEAIHVVSKVGEYQIRMVLGVDGKGANRVTEKRPDTNTHVGMVDLNQALKNGRNINSFSNGSVTLLTNKISYSESEQGFNRSGARWKYSVGKRA
jgi:hypothetical protein